MPRPTRVAKAAGTESLPNTPGGFDEAHERKVQARLLKSLEKQGRKSTSSSSGNSSDGLQLSTRKEAIEQWDAVSRQEGNSGQANGRPRANGQRRLSFENVIRAGKDEMSENIFLFVPNLIGYSRIILAALSLYFMEGNPKNCTVLYCISCLLDAFDGMAARALGQSTKFGAVLDMVTDRCTTSCLLCFLTARYPRCALLFQGLITLDFSSHYIHMYATLLQGSKSHKIVSKETSKWLSYYYNDSRTLFIFCAGNELFFVCLYLMAFYTRPLGIDPYYLLLPLGSANAEKILVGADFNPSSITAIALELIRSLTWPQLLGAITFPICAVKQLINAIQFWKAAQVLANVDLAERKAAGISKSR